MAQQHPGERKLYRAPHSGSPVWTSGPTVGPDKLSFSGFGDSVEAAPNGTYCLTRHSCSTNTHPQSPTHQLDPSQGAPRDPGPSGEGEDLDQTEASSDEETGVDKELSRDNGAGDLEDRDSSIPTIPPVCNCQGAPIVPEGPFSEGGDGSRNNFCTCCASPPLGEDEDDEGPPRVPRDPSPVPSGRKPPPKRQRHRLPTKEELRESGRRDSRPFGRHRPGRKRSQTDWRWCLVVWGSEELYRLGQKGFWWLIELLVLVGEYVETGGHLISSCGQLRGSDLDLLRVWVGNWAGQLGSWAQVGFLCLCRGLCSGAGLLFHLLRLLCAVLLLVLALLLGCLQLTWKVLAFVGDRLGCRFQATWLFSRLDSPTMYRLWTYFKESRTWQQLMRLVQRGWLEGLWVKQRTNRQGDGSTSSGRYYQPGEEVARLLAMTGIPEDELNPFQVLGVETTASDIELKKAYRQLAVMVHPDKNHHPRAEEAFKVLRAAWDIVSNPERRKEYEMKRMAESELSRSVNEFLSKLQDELKEAMNTMMCSRCQGKHRRFEMNRESQYARYCAECNKMHPAEEGDFWAESSMLGLKITYFAMMDGKIYDITEWAGCQRVGISPDTHRVPYHISFGSRIPGPGGRQRATPDAPPASVADLQDFFSRIFQVPPGQMPNGNFFAASQSGGPGATPPSRPDSSTAPKGSEAKPKRRKKLAELKQECLARGLETKGIKQDLINRLQAYLEEHAEEEANEEDVLGDETEEEEPKPVEMPVKEEEPPEKTTDVAAEKKVVKITSEIPQTERMQKRAERFNVPVSLESKKAARAARFGISSVPAKGLSSDTKPMVNMDKLKERAQRFGLNVSSVSKKSEDDEKLKKRKERFGIITSSAGTGTTEDTEAKKRKRAERFGIA